MAEEDTVTEGSAAPSRPSTRGKASGKGRAEAAAAGMPAFCRPRHYVRGANVFLVPLWDFTSRWMPEELKPFAAAAPTVAAAGTPAAPRRAAETEAGDSSGGYPVPPGADDDERSGSESEESEIAWDGPLGGESRAWSRAAVDGALLLLRRMQLAQAAAEAPDGPSASVYGLGVSAALFPPEHLNDGSDVPLDKRLAQVLRTREPNWAVFALRSGHFAGAVFRGQEALVHKAIHRYTVRAKAGGAQSAADSGKKIKSAGSTLRRYGEQRLSEEIRELLTDKWATEIAACELIFISVSKRMRTTLLGTEKDPFVPVAKVRKLPFMVGRPTFEAVREAYLKVASVVFVDEQTAESLCAKFKPAPVQVVADKAKPSSPTANGTSGQSDPAPAQVKYCEEEDELYTPLHAAAAAGDEEQIMSLLDDGADPRARDGKGRVPYYLCCSQKARDAFRRWRGSNEEEWDWQAAQVPEGITDETDQKRREKEKDKRRKQKEKQKVAKVKAKEEEEERKQREEAEARAIEEARAKCDSCRKPLSGKPFTRLQFMYCSTDCVNTHRRELQAEAALKRFGGSG